MISETTRAALRAQEFGGPFERRAGDDRAVSALMEGTIRLNPHPDFHAQLPIDWRADPFGDMNWRAQFHMLRWIDPLRRAAEGGDLAAFERWWSIVRSWEEECAEPTGAPEMAWRNMVDGIRAIELSLGLLVVEQYLPAELSRLYDLIERHGAWLADLSHRVRGNHALHQLQGLLLCGIGLGRREWIEQSTEELAKLFVAAYDEEGVNQEGAIAYHFNNFVWWRDAIRRLEVASDSIPAAFERHAAAAEELAHATQPDGKFVSIGDTLGGSPTGIDSPFTRYVVSGGRTGEPPAALVRLYQSGYLFARSGWGENERDFDEETFYSMVFGSNRKPHGHVDGGSITFHANRTGWVVDPGKFSYDQNATRLHFSQRHAHNIVTLEGHTHNGTRPVELRRSEIHPSHHDVIVEDVGYGVAAITRRLVYSVTGEYLVVIDTIRSSSDVTAVQSWQLGVDVEATVTKRSVVKMRSGTACAAIASVGLLPEVSISQGEREPLKGWVATGWRQMTPAARVELRKSGTAFRFITVIAAGFRESEAIVSSVPDLPNGVVGLDVSAGRAPERIVITQDEVLFPGVGSSAADITLRVDARSAHAGERVNRDQQWTYQEVRDVIIAAKRKRWDHAGSEAENLATILTDLGDPVVDHGLRAALADLTRRPPQEDAPAWRQGLINWSGESAWMPTRYPYPVESRRGLDPIALPTGPTILSHDLGHLTLPALWVPGDGSALVVLFHGALDRGRARLPMFQRLSSVLTLGWGPVLAFSDPTLDLSSSLRLGWYLGTTEIDLPRAMAEIVQSVARASQVDQVFLQGGSGGGFAAIATAVHTPEAVAVAFSPQTDIRAYAPRFVKECLTTVFPDGSTENGGDDVHRLTVMGRMGLAAHVPRIELIENSGDEFHRTKHTAPLADYVRETSRGLLTVTELDMGPGHRAPAQEAYRRVMSDIRSRCS